VDWLEKLADERIREAMERGEFDGLPLAGKPLPPDANAFVPEDLRIAYKLLKDAGFLPPEMKRESAGSSGGGSTSCGCASICC